MCRGDNEGTGNIVLVGEGISWMGLAGTHWAQLHDRWGSAGIEKWQEIWMAEKNRKKLSRTFAECYKVELHTDIETPNLWLRKWAQFTTSSDDKKKKKSAVRVIKNRKISSVFIFQQLFPVPTMNFRKNLWVSSFWWGLLRSLPIRLCFHPATDLDHPSRPQRADPWFPVFLSLDLQQRPHFPFWAIWSS